MPRAARLALIAAGVAVVVILVRRIGGGTVLDLLGRVGWGFALVSAIYAVHIAVRAIALSRCLPAGTTRFADVLRIRFAGEGIEMLTFTGPFLAEPAKGWLLKREGLETADAFGAIAIEYLLYTMVSAWLAAAALMLLLARGSLPLRMRTPVDAIVGAVAIATVLFLVAAVTGRGLFARFVPRIAPVEQVLVDFLHTRPLRLASVIGIEIAGHALLASEVWIVMAAIGLRVPVLDAVTVEGGVKFISVAFFFIPGQLGASEGVYALLAQAIGRSAAAGLTLALVRRVRALIVAVAGVAALATIRTRANRDDRPKSTNAEDAETGKR